MKNSAFLETLARIQVMSKEQAARFFEASPLQLSRTLERLKASGLIEISTSLVRQRNTAAPIAVIKPGDSVQCAGQIAYRAELLWKGALVPTVIIRPTRQLCTIFGFELMKPVLANLSHDVALSNVLLNRKGVEGWTLIRMRPLTGCLPDASSISGHVVIELVGRYNARFLSGKLAIAATLNATLELW